MINRLSHSRLGNISFIALFTISYFVPRSLRSLGTKYDIVPRAIKLISPRLSYDNLYIYINVNLYIYLKNSLIIHSTYNIYTENSFVNKVTSFIIISVKVPYTFRVHVMLCVRCVFGVHLSLTNYTVFFFAGT